MGKVELWEEVEKVMCGRGHACLTISVWSRMVIITTTFSTNTGQQITLAAIIQVGLNWIWVNSEMIINS